MVDIFLVVEKRQMLVSRKKGWKRRVFMFSFWVSITFCIQLFQN